VWNKVLYEAVIRYQREEDEESGDVSKHSAEWDLERTKHLECRHQVGRSSNAPDVSQRKQHVRHDLRVIQRPVKPSCQSKQTSRRLTHRQTMHAAPYGGKIWGWGFWNTYLQVLTIFCQKCRSETTQFCGVVYVWHDVTVTVSHDQPSAINITRHFKSLSQMNYDDA